MECVGGGILMLLDLQCLYMYFLYKTKKKVGVEKLTGSDSGQKLNEEKN